MRIEVRAVGLRAMREQRGLTQRRLAHELGVSQNYVPAIEAGARRAGPKLQEQLVKYLRVPVRGSLSRRISASATGTTAAWGWDWPGTGTPRRWHR